MNRSGFTLIELLTVIVIIGILASMASIKVAATRDQATRASMLVDLKTLVVAEESYYSVNADYTSKFSGVESSGRRSSSGTIAFQASPGNIVKLKRKGANGWNATIKNKSLTKKPKTCGIFIGPAGYSPNRNVVTPGVPTCY